MLIQNTLYKKQIVINDNISVMIPTVGDIVDNEEEYYDLVSLIVAMPIDMMVALDDLGIDFSTIDEWELFILLFNGIRSRNTSLVFGSLDLSKFKLAYNEQNGEAVLLDSVNGIVIDRLIHAQIANALRSIHHIEQDRRKPANEEARQFLIERARAKIKRRRNRVERSNLETLIIAMVNTEQYKYNYESTRDLTIFQFNEAVRQIVNKVDYEHRMHGVYAGTIDAKSLSPDDLTWLKHK